MLKQHQKVPPAQQLQQFRRRLRSTGAGRGLSATWLMVVCDLNSFFCFSTISATISGFLPDRLWFAATSCATCGACGGTQKILRFWRGALSRHGFPAENWCIWCWAVGHPFVIPFWGGHFPASISGKRHRGSTSCRAALVTTCRGPIPGVWSSDNFCKDSCRITSIICHIMDDDHVVLRSMVNGNLQLVSHLTHPNNCPSNKASLNCVVWARVWKRSNNLPGLTGRRMSGGSTERYEKTNLCSDHVNIWVWVNTY